MISKMATIISILTLIFVINCSIRITYISNFNQKFVRDKNVTIEEFKKIILFTYSLVDKFWILDIEEYFNNNYDGDIYAKS